MQFEIISCPPIGTHSIQCCAENKTVIVDSIMRRFTPIEYRLLVPLLERHQASDDELSQAGYACKADKTVLKNVKKHIDSIHSKLRPHGIDVRRVVKHGYIIVALE